MDLLQLRYFKKLAERENLTLTAQELMISAPSLSATISRLERDMGVLLFDRVGRSIVLNENGRIMLRHVDDIMHSLRNVEDELLEATQKESQTIKLGISAPSMWMEPIEAFLARHPGVSISHDVLSLPDMKSPSLGLSFDFIITASEDLSAEDWIHHVLVQNDRPVLIVYPEHEFARRTQMALIDAKNEPFIALSKGTSSRQFFDDVCRKAGFTPNVVIECDYLLRTQLVQSRFGIAFSSKLGSRSPVISNLKCVDIISPEFERTQSIICHKKRRISPTARLFLDFMLEYYHHGETTAQGTLPTF